MQVFQQTIDSKLAEIATLAQALEAWGEVAEVPPKALMEANLMLDELITNIIMHGYNGMPGHPVHISVTLAGKTLVLILKDFARPFNLLEQGLPNTELALEDRDIGGLGIHFVRKLADHIDYERIDESNVVTITKRFDTRQ